jgi:signal transduction histidine kinase
MFIEEILSQEFDVVTAGDGEEGLVQVDKVHPDLLVTDLMMPRLRGDELIQKIRSRSDLHVFPILILSARSDEELRVQLLREGASDFLMKPFEPEELKVRVHNLVTNKRARDILSQELSVKSDNLLDLANEAALRKRELQTALLAAKSAHEEAEKASHAKSTFLTLISHELHTPLTSILLTLQIFEKKGLFSKHMSGLKRLLAASKRLNNLIEALLNYTRVEAGKIYINKELIQPQIFLKEIISEYRTLAEDKKLKLEVEIDPRLSYIECDSKLLCIILDNLLSNAVKFTDRGWVKLCLLREKSDLRIEVSDSGSGIDKNDQGRIFEPFAQIQDIKKKSLPGIGLGLALVREIISQLGGSISVISESGKGSQFIVVLPTVVYEDQKSLTKELRHGISERNQKNAA